MTRRAAALAVAAAAAALPAAELLLAAAGDKPQWRLQSPGSWAVDDLDCRYRMRPGVYPSLFATAVRVNSYGVRGPEPRRPVVLAAGDSCTFGVGVPLAQTYPGLLTRDGWESVDAGVPGYNSATGACALRKSGLLDLHPKVVTLYFGWNDHERAVADEAVFACLRHWARHSRLASRLLRLQRSYWGDGWRRERWFRQVPPGQFESNLREMAEAARAAGARPWIVIPPSEPRLLAQGGRFLSQHTRAEFDDRVLYADLARRAAARSGAAVIDLDRELRARAMSNPRKYFIDPIHLNHRGHRVLAEMLEARLKAEAIAPDAGR